MMIHQLGVYFQTLPSLRNGGRVYILYFTIDSYPDIASESTWADFFNMATSSIQLYPKRYKAHSYSIIRMNMAPYLPNLFCWASVFILHLVKPRNKTTHQTHTHPPPHELMGKMSSTVITFPSTFQKTMSN